MMKINSKSSRATLKSIPLPESNQYDLAVRIRAQQNAAQKAVRWIGIGSASPDLSTNQQRMRGFGL